MIALRLNEYEQKIIDEAMASINNPRLTRSDFIRDAIICYAKEIKDSAAMLDAMFDETA